VITAGLAQRAQAGIKVRQPLAKATIPATFFTDESAREDIYSDIIAEELNVKAVEFSWTQHSYQERMAKPEPEASIQAVQEPSAVKLDFKISPQLRREGLAREVIRHVQQARKQAGLQVDDRINLALQTDDKQLLALLKDDKLTDVIKQETLAKSLNKGISDGDFSATVKVDDAQLIIGLSRLG